MPPSDLTPDQLFAGAREVLARYPDARLVKNGVGNLAIMVGGRYVAYLDLRTGEVEGDRGAHPGARALNDVQLPATENDI